MSGAPQSLDRRRFVIGAGLVGAAFAVAATPVGAQTAGAPVELGPWIEIHPDDTVIIRIGKSEIGQGVFTSNAMMVCEELRCDWKHARPEFVDPRRHMLGKLVYGRLETTAASSARDGREILQQVGASARERLKAAAAAQWNVPIAEVEAKDSLLTHQPTGRSLRFGEVAAHAASVKLDAEPKIKTPDQFTLMGTRVARLDSAMKARGEAIYSVDFRLPDMLFASLRMRPNLNAALKSYDFEAARALPGVLGAVDLRGVGGQEGVAIVANSWWRAESALKKTPIEWSVEKRAPESSAATLARAGEIADTRGLALIADGDAAAAFAGAAKKFDARYETPMLTHAGMETVNCAARYTPDRLELWVGTQSPETAMKSAAKASGLPMEKIFLQNFFLGGGFGGRAGRGEIEQAVKIAMAFPGKPVKLIWPREEEMRTNAYHPFGVTRCEAGLDAEGKPVAIKFVKAGDVTGEPQAIGPLKAVVNGQNSRSIYDLPYGVPAALVDIHDMRTGFPVGIWRSVGDYHNVFAIECFIDELARGAGADPLAYRKALLAAGTKYWNRDHWIAALDMLAKASRWGAETLPRGIGMGLAISDHRRPGRTDSSICAVAVQVTVAKDGALKVDRAHVVFEAGLGLINPLVVEQQLRGQMSWALGSLWQEVSVENGEVRQKNFGDYPVPRMSDIPAEITIDYLKTDRWNQGVGEMLVPMPPAAVCNAIHAAIGKRIRTLPLRRSDLTWT